MCLMDLTYSVVEGDVLQTNIFLTVHHPDASTKTFKLKQVNEMSPALLTSA